MSAKKEMQKHPDDTSVTLVGGSGGIFDVTVDNQLIFSKHKVGRFPEEGELLRLLEKMN